MLAAFALVGPVPQASPSALPQFRASQLRSLVLRHASAEFSWPEADGKARAQKDLPQ